MVSMKIAFICPVGGNLKDLHRTVNSYIRLMENVQDLSVELVFICIFNNGSKKQTFDDIGIVELDINPISSRAQARNAGIDYALKEKFTWVNFIDAGDIIDPVFLRMNIHTFSEDGLIVGGYSYGNIYEQSYVTRRKVNPVYRNPFYLSSVFVHTNSISNCRFIEGAKEDWQFWLDIITHDPRVKYVNGSTYIYTYKNTMDHIRRKMNVFGGTWIFFKRVAPNVLRASFRILIHYVLVTWDWVFKRSFTSQSSYARKISRGIVKLIQIAIQKSKKQVVQRGILKNKKFTAAHGSVLLPKLYDSYEFEIQQYVDDIFKEADVFWDIGCAEGYYVARYKTLKHDGEAFGIDIAPAALQLAAINLKNYSSISLSSDWRSIVIDPNCVMIDCEGYEYDLLWDNDFIERVRNAILIIEDHFFMVNREKDELLRRLKDLNYDVDIVPYAHRELTLYNFEARSNKTQYLIAKPKL